jgi:hypothetical protein
MPETGLNQFLDYGTTTTISACVGKVTGGSLNSDSALVHREGIGAQDSIVGGPVVPGGTADVIVQDGSLLAYAKRASLTAPSMTSLCFAGGYAGEGRKQTGAYINTMRLSCSVGEPLTASLEWLALTDDVYATAQKAYLAGSTFEWFTGTASIGGSTSLEVQSFEFNLNNNLEPVYSLDAKTTNQMRWPDSIKIGSQEVTLSVDCLIRPSTVAIADIFGDSLGTATTCIFTLVGGTSGTQTATLTVTNLSRKSAPLPFVTGGGLVTYALAYEAPKDASCYTLVIG